MQVRIRPPSLYSLWEPQDSQDPQKPQGLQDPHNPQGLGPALNIRASKLVGMEVSHMKADEAWFSKLRGLDACRRS